MAVKERVGTVVSDKMEKTVVVAVESRFPHPIYQKTVSRTTRYKAHDEDNSCRVGDRVRITETRPMSRHKRWTIAKCSVLILNAKEIAEIQRILVRCRDPKHAAMAFKEAVQAIISTFSVSKPSKGPISNTSSSPAAAYATLSTVEQGRLLRQAQCEIYYVLQSARMPKTCEIERVP